jgi:predicted PurR-regulated permease PerM
MVGMTRRIDISYRTIIFVTVFLLALWIIYQILDLIMLLFVAIIFMSALSPLVEGLQKIKIHKALSIAFIYVVLISLLITLLTISFTPIIEQTSNLIGVLPHTIQQIASFGHIDPGTITSGLPDLSKDFLSVSKGVFDNFLTIILLLVLTFYMLLEKNDVEQRAAALFVGKEERVKRLIEQIEEKLGAWLRGQLTLSLIISVAVYIGLTALQIPYALPLAIWAGLLEVVPVIGPIISSLPAILVALTISPFLGGATAALYFVIQQLENHIIVPQVMKRAVGLNPLLVIIAVAIGGRLLGIGGALLAVPITVVAQVIVSDIIKDKIA